MTTQQKFRSPNAYKRFGSVFRILEHILAASAVILAIGIVVGLHMHDNNNKKQQIASQNTSKQTHASLLKWDLNAAYYSLKFGQDTNKLVSDIKKDSSNVNAMNSDGESDCSTLSDDIASAQQLPISSNPQLEYDYASIIATYYDGANVCKAAFNSSDPSLLGQAVDIFNTGHSEITKFSNDNNRFQ